MKALIQNHTLEKKRMIFIIILIFIPIAFAFLAITMGRYPLEFGETFQTIVAKITGETNPEKLDAIVFQLRLPRIILALAVGTGLACAGAAFQALFANPLAAPDTLGVTAGASVGAILALLFSQGLVVVQISAFLFGLLATLITVTVAKIKGSTSITMLVLSGVIVAALFSAVVSILKYIADPDDKLPAITYWLMGGLAGTTYKTLALGLPFIIVGVIIIFSLRWRLNILALSEDEARAAGIRVQRLRILIVIAATMITASCVAMCGQVGWVGLLIPHCARMICGSNNRYVIPISVSLGAVFMLFIDTLSRTLMAAEIPVSILTALIGAPVFISLLRKTGGNWS